ncbi:MAG: hypothetical protein ACP5FZ_06760, partial [Fidelibacterota bacterium]
RSELHWGAVIIQPSEGLTEPFGPVQSNSNDLRKVYLFSLLRSELHWGAVIIQPSEGLTEQSRPG